MLESLAALDETQRQRWAQALRGLGLDLRRLRDDADCA
jgi:putative AlgH/UPF0301 family transcriptional regulator